MYILLRLITPYTIILALYELTVKKNKKTLAKPAGSYIMTAHTRESKTMKIRNGWVLNIDGIEATVGGSLKIRGTQIYLLLTGSGKRSIKREELLAGMSNGSIKYVASVAV